MNIKIKSMIIVMLLVFQTLLFGCNNETKTVVVYTSVDQVYSEKIFEIFEKQTGIKVKAVYDIEASKTVGLANKLVSEKNNPQADVFWNGEILLTIDLKEKGVLSKSDIKASKKLPPSFIDSEDYWYGFGGRARILIYNKTLISQEDCPKTLNELARSQYIKNTGIAYPVFGTTATHAAALYTTWSDSKAKEYFTLLKSSGISVLEGNSVVKDFVSSKKLFMGLTDTDDAFAEMAKNKDLDVLLLDQGENDIGSLVIPNTVALINGAPNPEQANAFIEFLLSPETEQALVDSGWIHIPVHSNVTPSKEFKADNIKIQAVDFSAVYKKLEASKNDMIEIFAK